MRALDSYAPSIDGIYARAGELARLTGRIADLFPTIWGAWLVAFISGDLPAAKRLLDELFNIANTTKENALIPQAHHAAWPTSWVTGLLRTLSNISTVDWHFTDVTHIANKCSSTVAMIQVSAGTQLEHSLELQWVISIMAIWKWRRRFALELDIGIDVGNVLVRQ